MTPKIQKSIIYSIIKYRRRFTALNIGCSGVKYAMFKGGFFGDKTHGRNEGSRLDLFKTVNVQEKPDIL